MGGVLKIRIERPSIPAVSGIPQPKRPGNSTTRSRGGACPLPCGRRSRRRKQNLFVHRRVGGKDRPGAPTTTAPWRLGRPPPKPGAVPRAEEAWTFGPSPDRSILPSKLLHPLLRSSRSAKSPGESKHGHRAARLRLGKSDLSDLLFDPSCIGSLHVLPSLRLSVSHLVLRDLGQGLLRLLSVGSVVAYNDAMSAAPYPRYSKEEFARRGNEIYEREVQPISATRMKASSSPSISRQAPSRPMRMRSPPRIGCSRATRRPRSGSGWSARPIPVASAHAVESPSEMIPETALGLSDQSLRP